MYIACQLPNEYGAFKQIQKENYPFNHTFETYLNTLAQIGLDHQFNIDELIGFIEDGIYKEKRVSDIPNGDEPIAFRLKTTNPVIMSYYEQQAISNRHVTLLLIRMTLRLSAVCGNSLSRITYKAKALSEGIHVALEEQKDVQRTPKEVQRTPAKVSISVDNKTEDTSVKEALLSPTAKEQKKQAVEQRLESLVKKGDEVLEQRDTPVTVNTNPLLADFL